MTTDAVITALLILMVVLQALALLVNGWFRRLVQEDRELQWRTIDDLHTRLMALEHGPGKRARRDAAN